MINNLKKALIILPILLLPICVASCDTIDHAAEQYIITNTNINDEDVKSPVFNEQESSNDIVDNKEEIQLESIENNDNDINNNEVVEQSNQEVKDIVDDLKESNNQLEEKTTIEQKEEVTKNEETVLVTQPEQNNIPATEVVEKNDANDTKEILENVNKQEEQVSEIVEDNKEEKNVIHLPYFNELDNQPVQQDEDPIQQDEDPVQQSEDPVQQSEEVIELTDLQKYMKAAAEQGIAIAEYFDEKATTALDQQLLLYPYSNMDEYPEIQAEALLITANCTTEEEKIQTIYNWADTQIAYNYKYLNATTYYTFKNKVGVCSQKATIMHDMLSAVGIQSYYVSGVWGNETMSVHQAINSYYYGISGKHAWVIAKVDGEWKYYDPTIKNYAMSAEDLMNNGYSCTSVDSIHCLPETYDISLTDVTTCEAEAPVLILRDGEIGSYRNNEYFNEYKYRNYFNGNFCIYKQTYSVVVFTSHLFALTENAVIQQDKMFSSIIWYQATTMGTYTNPAVYRPADYGTRFWVFTSTGRKVHGLDALQYLIDVYGLEETNTILEDTVFSVQEDGLYINHLGADYLLETFEDHNETVCHYNFLD